MAKIVVIAKGLRSHPGQRAASAKKKAKKAEKLAGLAKAAAAADMSIMAYVRMKQKEADEIRAQPPKVIIDRYLSEPWRKQPLRY